MPQEGDPEGYAEGRYGPPASPEEPESDGGWTPVDMSTVFSGNFTRPRATLGKRHDGVHLLYPGREHVVSAEPESAKTWLVCLIVADVLREGGHVLYIDFEDDEGTIGMRSHWLGAQIKTLCDPSRFRYIRPEEGVTFDRYVRVLNFGTDDEPVPPTLVVLDGTTEGYGLHGWDIKENGDSPKWRNTYVKPALRAGAATLATDHVVKNADARGGYAIGAQHKKAGLTGALFELRVQEPFGIGMRGRSKLYLNKDRTGDLRQHGVTEGKATYFGDLVLDATDVEGCPQAWLFPPNVEGEEVDGAGSELDPKVVRMREVEQVLRLRGPLNARDLRNAIPGRGSEIDKAVQSMLNLGTLHDGEMVKGPAKLRHLPGQCREGMKCFATGVSAAA